MPKRRGPNSELMIQAAAEGARIAMQGQEAVLRQKEGAAEGFQDVGRQLVGMGERQLDREQQSKEAEKERAFRSGEGLKERVARSGEQAKELRSREKIEEGRLGLAAAEAGLEEVPQEQGGGAAPTEAAPPGGAVDPRQQALAQEMERGKAQMDKPLESAQDGKPRYRAGEAKLKKEAADQQIRMSNAETAAINARNARERLNNQILEAQYKQDQVALKELRTQIQAPIKADQRLRDDIGTGKLLKGDPRWAALKEMISDPLTGQHPSAELVQEVESETNGPHLARFISNRQASAGIKMALDTGDLPDSELIDTTNPMWQQFFAQTKQAEQFLGGTAIGQFVDIRSVQHKQRLVNKAAALIMSLQPMLGAQSPQQSPQQPQGGAGAPQQQSGAPAPAPVSQPAAQPQRRQPSVGELVGERGFSGGGPR